MEAVKEEIKDGKKYSNNFKSHLHTHNVIRISPEHEGVFAVHETGFIHVLSLGESFSYLLKYRRSILLHFQPHPSDKVSAL
jgi:hypothetical protein